MTHRLFRPPRRLRFHRAGWVVSTSAVGLGLAAMATGNNLLYLLLGALLGLIALSGWLSEVTLRGVEVARVVPRGVEAGAPALLGYEVRNRKRMLPSFALEVGERSDAGRGFVASLAPGAGSGTRVERVWDRRGVYPLETITLSTSFPFGLFQKERDLDRQAEVVVWPWTGRAIREPRPAGDRTHRSGSLAAGASGARGEYRSLRTYLPGDDPRDVHWRSTARAGEPVVREYAREQAQTLWLCLHLGAAPGDGDDRVELAVEIVAALAARAAGRGEPFGLATSDERLPQGSGRRHLEEVLDALARARFRPGAPPPTPPAPPQQCVLVAAGAAAAGADWGEVYLAAEAT